MTMSKIVVLFLTGSAAENACVQDISAVFKDAHSVVSNLELAEHDCFHWDVKKCVADLEAAKQAFEQQITDTTTAATVCKDAAADCKLAVGTLVSDVKTAKTAI